jgi:hypothetical protein
MKTSFQSVLDAFQRQMPFWYGWRTQAIREM